MSIQDKLQLCYENGWRPQVFSFVGFSAHIVEIPLPFGNSMPRVGTDFCVRSTQQVLGKILFISSPANSPGNYSTVFVALESLSSAQVSSANKQLRELY